MPSKVFTHLIWSKMTTRAIFRNFTPVSHWCQEPFDLDVKGAVSGIPAQVLTRCYGKQAPVTPHRQRLLVASAKEAKAEGNKGNGKGKGKPKGSGKPKSKAKAKAAKKSGKEVTKPKSKTPYAEAKESFLHKSRVQFRPNHFSNLFFKASPFFLNPEPTDLETRFRIWVLQVEFVCIYLQQQIHYMHMRKKIDQLTLSNSHVQRYVTIYTYISNILPTFAFYIICIHIRSTSMSNTNAMCKYVCMCNLRRL